MTSRPKLVGGVCISGFNVLHLFTQVLFPKAAVHYNVIVLIPSYCRCFLVKLENITRLNEILVYLKIDSSSSKTNVV